MQTTFQFPFTTAILTLIPYKYKIIQLSVGSQFHEIYHNNNNNCDLYNSVLIYNMSCMMKKKILV